MIDMKEKSKGTAISDCFPCTSAALVSWRRSFNHKTVEWLTEIQLQCVSRPMMKFTDDLVPGGMYSRC